MANEFTWFEKITKVSDAIEDEGERAVFILAVVDYGAKGIEPDLHYPLNGFFECIREDIDNSVNKRKEKRGGRPRKQGVSEMKITTETPSSETKKQGVSETENTSLYMPKPSQDMPKPSQGKEKPKKRTTFSPPLIADIEAFWQDEKLRGSPSEFIDYYTAQGWKLSNGNAMKDWKAAARNWSRRQEKWEGGSNAVSNVIEAIGEVAF